MVYRIVAARENETVRWERTSELIAVAKARVWTSEGWHVEITDDEGRTLDHVESELPLADNALKIVACGDDKEDQAAA